MAEMNYKLKKHNDYRRNSGVYLNEPLECNQIKMPSNTRINEEQFIATYGTEVFEELRIKNPLSFRVEMYRNKVLIEYNNAHGKKVPLEHEA